MIIKAMVNGRTWPKFELVQYYIYLFPVQVQRDRINRALERVGTVFIDDLGSSTLRSEIWPNLILI